jgi:hypothetical protein
LAEIATDGIEKPAQVHALNLRANATSR